MRAFLWLSFFMAGLGGTALLLNAETIFQQIAGCVTLVSADLLLVGACMVEFLEPIRKDLAAIREYLLTRDLPEPNAKCPACSARITVDPSRMGHAARCPSCGKVVKAEPLQRLDHNG